MTDIFTNAKVENGWIYLEKNSVWHRIDANIKSWEFVVKDMTILVTYF